MKTFSHWRAVGRAMLDARRREGVTVEQGGGWRSGDTRVIVTDNRRNLIIDLPEGGYLDAGHLNAGQALRVLAALDLIPADIAYAVDDEQCAACGSVLHWWPPEGRSPGRWQHLDVKKWAAIGPHRAEVAS